MAFVETDIQDQIIIIKLNRPERLNALSAVIREGMADAFNKFKNDKQSKRRIPRICNRFI